MRGMSCAGRVHRVLSSEPAGLLHRGAVAARAHATWRVRRNSPCVLCQQRSRAVHMDVKLKYEGLVAAGELRLDSDQLRVVEQLQALQRRLDGYQLPSPSLLQKLFGSRPQQIEKIKGMYMYGSVGAGKTMLMDLFFESTRVCKKQRVHFNAFMLDVHDRIHEFKQSLSKATGREKPHAYDPIGPVARDIAAETHLLCFDEFQVTDIVDAMILKRLFTTLFDSGVVVVATSNRQPDDLYKNGVQRGNFIPFIRVLKDHCSILQLDSGIDYRQMVLATAGQVYITPNTEGANQKLLEVFEDLSQEDGVTPSPRVLTFLGRELLIPRAAGSLALLTFQDLCVKPLSAADYLELCRHFHTIFVKDIPKMTIRMRPEARRFITFIDTLYEYKVKLVCTAAVPPQELFREKVQRSREEKESRVLMDELDIMEGSLESHASIFTGEEEVFAFQRTVSRLKEMQGEEYWNTDHIIPRTSHKK